MNLKQRTVVVSGAGGGLGTVLARELAAQGVSLALLGRSSQKLQALAGSLALPEIPGYDTERRLVEAR